jgi:hypothetical protein
MFAQPACSPRAGRHTGLPLPHKTEETEYCLLNTVHFGSSPTGSPRPRAMERS